MNRSVYVLLAIICLFSCALFPAMSEAKGDGHYLLPMSEIPDWNEPNSDTVLLERCVFGDYVFESVGVHNHARFTISKAGQVLYTRGGEQVHCYRAGYRTHASAFYNRGDRQIESVIPPGTDITGDGIPNLLVTSILPGNWGGWRIDLFDIGEEFRHIQTISEVHGNLFDSNGNGAMEYFFGDRGFGYLPAFTGGGRAYTPYPTIVLSYQGEAYKLDPGLMRAAPPIEAKLKTLADKIRNAWPDEGVRLCSSEHSAPIEFVSKIINFVYEGNLDSARYIEKHAVPEYARYGVANVILPEIYKAIGSSRYADQLRQMNGVASFWPAKD